MKIYVKSNDAPTIRINLPTGLLLNPLTARVAVKSLEKHVKLDEYNLKNLITTSQANALFAEMKRMKRKYPDLYLVDIESADGEIVKIKL